MKPSITPTELEDRFEDAALTLRRLPHPRGSGARGYGSSWPDYVRDAWHVYGRHEASMRVIPSARDIQRMEEAIDWLRLADPEDARIVWLRAERVRWRQICVRLGVVRSTAWRRWAAALVTISKRLAANDKSTRPRGAPKRVTPLPDVEPASDGVRAAE